MSPSDQRTGLGSAPQSRRIPFLILLALVLLVFHPAFQGELLRWDDDVNITHNPHLRGLDWESIKWSLTDTKYYWRYQPLAWITWNAIYQFAGLKPFAYHFLVVLLHAFNAGLVFLLIENLLRLACAGGAAQPSPDCRRVAFLAAALWALHPMRAEPVAWAVELVYVLPLTFLLLALLAYLRATETPVGQKKFYWLSVAGFAASLFTFPIALGGLAVFVVLDILPLRRLGWNPRDWMRAGARRIWLEKIPFLALTLLAAGLNLHARAYHLSRGKVLPTLEDFSPFARIMQGFYIWAYYAWKPLLPFRLTPVPMQLYNFDPWEAVFVASAGLVIGLTIGLFLARRRWPAVFLVWVCHLALLVPMLGLSEHPHFPSDRYGLVVGIGGAVLFAGLLLRAWHNPPMRRFVAALAALLITALALLTYRQTLIWQTNEKLFAYVLANLPPGPRSDAFRVSLHLRRAAYYCGRGDFARGAAAARQAIQLGPELAAAHRMLGYALMESGELDAARASYERAVKLDASLAGELNDLGVAFAVKGRLPEAVEQFRAVLLHEPTNANARQNLERATATLSQTTNSANLPDP